MIVTEQEATKKACPFARQFNADEPTYNETAERLAEPCCIGSRCMAWDWIGSDTQFLTTNGTISGTYAGASYARDHRPGDVSVKEEDGWVWREEKRSYAHAPDRGWWVRSNPERKGQCLRTVTVEHGG